MSMKSIPCMLMRGGTSRGPYFLAADLPADEAARDRVLLAAMGSPDLRQIDGLGGADALTSKAAIVSRSDHPGVDVDYLFAQVDINRPVIDTSPSCGNILSGVAPFAIETGLVRATPDQTRVMIRNVNTNSRIEAIVQTPGGRVTYEGDARIDGVPGTSAPIMLNFMDVVGSKTGALFPTGRLAQKIADLNVTCIDVAMPMMLVRAEDLGLSGEESHEELANNVALLQRLEPLRIQAGALMGLGDVAQKVIPKIAVVGPPREGGDIYSRYFMPWRLHAAHAVTGATCVATASVVKGTVAYDVARASEQNPRELVVEHPSGQLAVCLETAGDNVNLGVVRAGVMRTSRLIMKGEVFVSQPAADQHALA